MINKKLIIISLLILILMSVHVVSASDDADVKVLGDDKEIQILSAPTETQNYADLKNLIDTAITEDRDEISLEYNYQYNEGNPRTGINITKDLTIIGNGATINGGSVSALFNISSGVTVTLKNLTITYCGGVYHDWNAEGQPTYVFHAISSEGTLNIDECTFENNNIGDWSNPDISGVIYSTNDIFINNSRFINNQVQTYGVIYTTGTVSVNNSYFEGNKASRGGAIYADCISFIENSTFKSNVGRDANAAIDGGAIYINNENSVTSIKNSTFTANGNNKEESKGGAVYTNGAISLIEKSIFSNNAANGGGKSIYINGTSTALSIINSTFEGGDYDYALKGGAIYTNSPIDLIENSTFKSNWASYGGAVYINNENSMTTIKNSTFTGHLASNNGGVIYTEGNIDSIINSTFETNMALVGGAIYTTGINLIDNSTFTDTGNPSRDSKGGALYIKGNVDLLITNSTFEGDMADEGGAIFINASVTVKDSSFTNNAGGIFAESKGGAIYANGSVEIRNVTLEYNIAKYGGAIYSNDSVTVYDCDDVVNNGANTDGNHADMGGVIYAKSNVEMNNTVFGANYANVAGGAVYSEGNVNFYNSSVNGSAATSDNGNGGFIYAKGNVNVENSTVESIYMKVADGNGMYSGAIYTEGNIFIKNSTFNGTNRQDNSYGGAIRAFGNAEIYCSNFTNNLAATYGAGYIGGTLDIYDSYFINNTRGTIFAEGVAVVNNTSFINNTGGISLNGRAIGSNSTLNLTNSYVVGTNGTGGQFNGTIFSNGNLYIANCNISDNHAFAAQPKGMAIYTNSNITIINCTLDNNTFSGNDVYGGAIFAGINAYVLNCSFTNSSLLERSGQSHGIAIYANENITVYNSTFENLQSWNSEHGALSGKYVNVSNSNFTNIFGFGAFGAAIHADVANVTNSSFYLVNSTDNKDNGGAIYANDVYAYNNNFTLCHAGRGGAIYALNYTTAIENIFIDNCVQYSGGAIYTKNGFIEYNVFIGNGITNAWGDLCDVAFTVSQDELDSLELNWWGHNRPFVDYGENRAKTSVSGDAGGIPYLPDTWVIMKFFITDPTQPYVGQGVNLTTTLEDYYNTTDGTESKLNHNIAERTVIYNSKNIITGDDDEGRFSHTTAPIINEDTVLYATNDFLQHNVSSTIDYQTLTLTVAQFEINVTKIVSNSTPKVGDVINYTITVTNHDLTDYTNPDISVIPHPDYFNITITDILDGRLQFVSCNDSNYNNETGIWFIENMGINSTHKINITVRVRGSGNITNYANITKVNETELTNPYGGNVTIYVEESSEDVQLSVVKELVTTGNVVVGDKITYTITVTNNGVSDASNVVVTDTLVGPGSIVAGECVVPDGSSLVDNVWTISSLAGNGGSATLTLVVLATDVGTVKNSVIAKADENSTEVSDSADDVPVGPDVRLSVVKDVVGDVSSVHVGDKITYTITVTNNGASSASNVRVTDTLSGPGSIVAGECVVPVGSSLVDNVWTISSLAGNGASMTLRLVVVTTASGTVANGVVAKADENTTEVSGSAPDVPVGPDVRLSVVKDVVGDVSSVHVGDKITYTITVTNNGASSASNVVVTDTLSGPGSIVAGECVGPDGSSLSGNVWTIDSLAGNGASVSLTLVVVTTASGTVANGVVAKADENTTEVSGSAPNVGVDSDVRLSVVKDVVGDVSSVHVGDKITYTITVTNNGASSASNVVVTDTLSGPGSIVAGECVVPVGSSLVDNVWTIDSLAGNGASVSLTLVVVTTASGTVANGVVAKADENTTEVSGSAPNVGVDSDVRLSVVKDVVGDVSSVHVGDKITYTITVTNNGASSASNVVVTDTLSGPGSIVAGECVGPDGSSLSGNVWTIDSLAGNGASVSLTLVVVTTASGTVANGVVAKADENTTEVSGSAPNVGVDSDVRLSVVKDVVGDVSSVHVGDKITYTITVTNNGASSASNVVVTDTLSGPGSIVAGECVVPDGSSLVDNVWTIDSLAGNGASVSLTLVVVTTASGTVANGVVAKADENTTEVSGSAPDVPVGPDVRLSVVKDVVGDVSSVHVGDKITYTITVTNNGASSASNVVVTDTLSGPGSIVAGECVVPDGSSLVDNVWTISSLAGNGASVSLTLVVVTTASGTVANSVVAKADENTTEVSDTADDVTVNSDVRLNVTKKANATDVVVGDYIKFTITVNNTGSIKATQVNITDTLSDAFEFYSASGDGVCNSGVVTWNIGDVNVGIPVSVELIVKVTKEGKFNNTATAVSNENENKYNGTENITAGTVLLNITKEANVSSAVAGDYVKFTITVNNTGSANATNVVIYDILPSGFKYVSGGSYDDSTRNVTWTIDRISANDFATVELIASAETVGNLSNVAYAYSNNNQTVVNGTSDNVTVNPNVKLAVSKVVNGYVTSVIIGDYITYTITVVNNGKSDASDVNVTERLSGPVVVTSASGDGSWDNNARVWYIDSISANGGSATLTLTVRVVGYGVISNSVVAKCKENDTEVETNARDIPSSPNVQLSVVKKANVTAVSVGDAVKFTITVTNSGRSTANNVIISDNLDSSFGFVESDGTYNNKTHSIVWYINQIGSGGSANVYVVVNALNNGTFTNVASAYSDESGTVSGRSEQVTVSPLVDVAISLSVDNSTPNLNGEITITLKVRNNGPSNATNVTGKLDNDFLTALRIISVNSVDIIFNQGLLGSALNDILTINEDGTFTISQLNANQEVSATIKATVLREGNITVDGNVSSNEKDSNISNNYDEITLNVQPAVDLSVNKTVSNSNPTWGDIIEYTIAVSNAGPSNATEIVVTEKLPDGLIYISDDSNGSYDINTGIWNIISLNANETASLTIKVKVNSVGEITNRVNASSKEKNINPNGNNSNVTIRVNPKPVDLKLTVDANNTKPTVGDLVEFTVTIANNGIVNATGVNVYNYLPEGSEFISDDGESSYDSSSGIWSVGNLSAGQTKVLHVIVKVTKDGNVTYSVVATANEEIENATSLHDSITIEVVKQDKHEDENKTHVHPKVHLRPTGNPVIVLVMALLLVGVSLRRKKE